MKRQYKNHALRHKFLHVLVLALVAVFLSGCVMATWAGMLLPALVVVAIVGVPLLLLGIKNKDR